MLGTDLQKAGAAVEERLRQRQRLPARTPGGLDVDNGLKAGWKGTVHGSMFQDPCSGCQVRVRVRSSRFASNREPGTGNQERCNPATRSPPASPLSAWA